MLDATAVAVLSALTDIYTSAEIIAYLTPTPTPPVIVAPPVVLTPTAATFGINLGGSVDPLSDPSLHATYLNTFARFAPGGIARVWFTGTIKGAIPLSQFAVARHFAPAGVKMLGVVNFQNSVTPGMAPAAQDWLDYLNSFPTAAVSGFTYIEIGNEIDLATYFGGTLANYVALLAAAYPILKAKGYLIVCGNTYYSTPWPDALNKAGAMAHCDFVGRHPYESTAAGALADIQKCIAFANSVGKGVLITELGLHANPKDPTGWAAQIELLIAGVKGLPIIAIYFSMNQQTATQAGPEGLLMPDGSDNTLFTTAFTQGLAA